MKNMDTKHFQVIEQFATTEKAIAFLRANGILATNPPQCDIVGCVKMTEIRHIEGHDGVIWRCPKHKGRKKTIRTGSLLENVNIPLETFLHIVHFWAFSIPVGKAQQEANVSNKTAIQWYQCLRDICSVWLVDNPMKLGGPDTVVQVDDMLIAQEKDGGRVVSRRWVFGIYDCNRNLGYMEFVNVRNRDTILPIILSHVLPGTVIQTNYSSPYVALPAVPVIPPYTHVQVDLTADFVDPVTARTDKVQCLWKTFIKNKEKMNNSAARLQSHLNEFLWRQLYGEKPNEAFLNILHQIAVLYPV